MAGTKAPGFKLRQSLSELLFAVGKFSDSDINRLLSEAPHKWEKHGDLVVIPQNALRSESWKLLGIVYSQATLLLQLAYKYIYSFIQYMVTMFSFLPRC